MKRDDGISTLELGMVLPVLLVLMSMVMPVVKAGWEYMVLSRATAHGIRYATRVDANPRISSEGHLTRRPTAAEVETFVRDAAEPLSLSSVAVSPAPSTTLSGDLVTVRARYVVDFGPMADLANGVASLFVPGADVLPVSREITVTARGREE